jgi:hypothetical protein
MTMSQPTRREFLRKAAAAGSILAANSLCRSGPAHESADGDDKSARVTNPLIVVTGDVSVDVNPRARSWGYLEEVLRHGGLFFDLVPVASLSWQSFPKKSIILLAGDLPLDTTRQELLRNLVRQGVTLIGVGGPSGLHDVFGISGQRPLAEGWINVTEKDHPLTSDLRSSLHVFGGYAVQPDTATPLADLQVGRQGAKGAAILQNSYGDGRAILLAPDLLFSIVHIQQGLPVLQDRPPAADGTADVNDGELKAEDGLVLDWERDRTVMQPDGVPIFLEPITDELRAIIMRSVFYAAHQNQLRLPVLWHWPRDLPAVGHISHDTDGHDPQKAESLRQVMNRCDVRSTWCTLYPGGYPREFFETLKQQGFEIALHYDARTGDPETSWSRENLQMQHQWLLEATGVDTIVSNKNHYTRWESRLDFVRWCEELGIVADQTRGPSKQGTIGFPLGGSHPYFFWDDESDPPRRMDVLELNLLTQDLVVVCPAEYGQQLLDTVVRQHGVAHFLFHPAHIEKPGVADALCNLVDYGREQGLEWWTNEQIYRWEILRRDVTVRFDTATRFHLHVGRPLRDATLMFLRIDEGPALSVARDGKPVETTVRSRYGFEFDCVTTNLTDGSSWQIG